MEIIKSSLSRRTGTTEHTHTIHVIEDATDDLRALVRLLDRVEPEAIAMAVGTCKLPEQLVNRRPHALGAHDIIDDDFARLEHPRDEPEIAHELVARRTVVRCLTVHLQEQVNLRPCTVGHGTPENSAALDMVAVVVAAAVLMDVIVSREDDREGRVYDNLTVG
jgi:hypothetical protein